VIGTLVLVTLVVSTLRLDPPGPAPAWVGASCSPAAPSSDWQ
jgi:hypothetical protein